MSDDFMKKILARMEELQMTNVKPSPNAIILATGSGFKPPGKVDYSNNTRLNRRRHWPRPSRPQLPLTKRWPRVT